VRPSIRLFFLAALMGSTCASAQALGEPHQIDEPAQEIDPWEPFNRRTHAFNQKVDAYVAKPVATFYTGFVPGGMRQAVGNFFTNLYQPVAAVNLLLQGKPKEAGSSVLRFALNTTLGLGGLLDPATDAGLRIRREDFGQTLAVWGWDRSRYLVLPFLGPTTVRDGFGEFGDYRTTGPFRHVDHEEARHFLQGLYLVDLRAQALAADQFIGGAADDYLLFRDAFLQRRRFMINDGESDLPDYLFDIETTDPAGDGE
jgi:phospholipid-binding lipoprotein MlaA